MGRRQSPGNFNMAEMGAALPDYQGMTGIQSPNAQHGFVAPQSSLPAYQTQHFAGHVHSGAYPMVASQYSTAYQDQIQSPTVFGSPPSLRGSQQTGPGPIQPGYPPSYYHGHHVQNTQQPPFLPFAGSYTQSSQMGYPAQFPTGPNSAFAPQAADVSMLGGRAAQNSFVPGMALQQPPISQFARPGNASGKDHGHANFYKQFRLTERQSVVQTTTQVGLIYLQPPEARHGNQSNLVTRYGLETCRSAQLWVT